LLIEQRKLKDINKLREKDMNTHENDTQAELAAWEILAETRAKLDKLKEALEIIANEDYRGNRPQSAYIAEKALNSIKP